MAKKEARQKTNETVAQVFDNALRLSGRPLVEIADELGVASPNFLTLLRKGRSRVPLDKITAIAIAVDLDPNWFLMLCLREYLPSLAMAIEKTDKMKGTMLSEDEFKTIRIIRSAGSTMSPSVRKAALKSIEKIWAESK